MSIPIVSEALDSRAPVRCHAGGRSSSKAPSRGIDRMLCVGLSLVAAAALSACDTAEPTGTSVQASGGTEPQTYADLVVFGDGYSDVGSHRTPGIAAMGGGLYTVNGDGAEIWVQVLAHDLDLTSPCPARTGLLSSGAFADLAAPMEDHPGCFGYAHGGARITDPVGPWNRDLLAGGDASGYLGQLTNPVANQIARHLLAYHSFSGNELVTVFAGLNDMLINLFAMQGAIAQGADPQLAAVAAATHMGQAGDELAAYVKVLLVGYGAKRVVVLNMPDPMTAPAGRGLQPEVQTVVRLMARTFNEQLAAGLAGMPEVLQVDFFALSQDTFARPSFYGLSNVTDRACDPSEMPFDNVLVCVAPATVVDGDISHYLFADGQHVTPYGHRVIAARVIDDMVDAGWIAPPGPVPCYSRNHGCEPEPEPEPEPPPPCGNHAHGSPTAPNPPPPFVSNEGWVFPEQGHEHRGW